MAQERSRDDHMVAWMWTLEVELIAPMERTYGIGKVPSRPQLIQP